MSSRSLTLEKAIKERRSIRTLRCDKYITKQDVESIVRMALNAPSAFNMQSSRMIILMEDEHRALWKIVHDTLQKIVSPDRFAQTAQKLKGFADGCGTILFYENEDVVKEFQEKVPSYSDKFPTWSQHNNAILQYACWLGLTDSGLAASLQHYNPLIDDEVAKRWNISKTWSLVAQMPFGLPSEIPEVRYFEPFEKIVQFHG